MFDDEEIQTTNGPMVMNDLPRSSIDMTFPELSRATAELGEMIQAVTLVVRLWQPFGFPDSSGPNVHALSLGVSA